MPSDRGNRSRLYTGLALGALFVVIAFVSINVLYSNSLDIHRQLAEDGKFLPEDGRYFEWPGKKVRNKTNSQLPKLFKQLLTKRLRRLNDSAVPPTDEEEDKQHLKEPLSMEIIGRGIDQLGKDINEHQLTQNEATHSNTGRRHHRMGGPLVEALPGVNNFEYLLKHDKKTDHAAKNRLVEHLGSQFEKVHDDRSLAQLIDIVVVTGSTPTDVNFLESWRQWIADIHVIIIQQGDPTRHIDIPEWVDYELYTKVEVEKAVGSEKMWIFDMDGDSNAAYNFGFLIADREIVYMIDRFNKPKLPAMIKDDKDAAAGQRSSSSSSSDNLVLIHAAALTKPSLIYYYNSPGNDPFRKNTDFKRGYPYSLREGVQTALTVGDVEDAGHSDFDHLTSLMASSSDATSTSTSSSDTDNQDHSKPSSKDHANLQVSVVPHKSLFSLSTRNVAFSRTILGPSFVLLGAVGSPVRDKGRDIHFDVADTNYDLILGWFLKVLGDHVGFGVKDITSPIYLTRMEGRDAYTDKNPTPSQTGLREGNNEVPETVGGISASGLKSDLLWLQYHEQIVRFFSSVELSANTINDVPEATKELSGKMRDSKIHPIFLELCELIEFFTDLWNKRNSFHQSMFPVAKRSSTGPKADGPHQCAMFTIAHNETFMLEVWLRYYGQHFPNENSLWILNHLSGDDSAANEVRVSKKLLTDTKARVENLYGDRAGFPMGFFTTQADLMQRRLLRQGYKCVMMSDVDEIVVPSPEMYPQGLKEYLRKFQDEMDKPQMRVNGYIVAHISNPDGDENTRIEPAIDWTKSILSQRHFMAPQGRYCKPLLVKVPVRYKAGFHNVFIPGFIPMDENLMMFHLRDVDRDFCLTREAAKHSLIKRGHQSEIDKVLNVHIVQHDTLLKKGEVCSFALGTFYVKFGNRAVDNTGKQTLEEIPEAYRQVSM